MASKLRAVAPKAASPSKSKILIFGKPGVGKTWAALDWPQVYYIDTEGGADLAHYTAKLERSGGMYMGPEQGSLSFETLLEQIVALATEKHSFKTVVIDSITKIFQTEIANEAERLGDKDAFGASKKSAVSYMRRLTSWLQRIDMNVIMIAHEKPLWGLDEKKQRSEIGVCPGAWDRLEYELHLVLNIVKAGPRRIAKVGKSRLTGFEEASTFEWSYANFAEKFGKDFIEADTKQLVLATPDQLAELTHLLETVRLPEGQAEKWLTAAGVSDFAEMDGDKVEKCIASLKAKLAA